MTGWPQTRSMDPMQRPERSDYALQSAGPFALMEMNKCYMSGLADCLPECALYIRAMLSILPVMKKTPSGDQARS